jgi:hypothetical protein
MSRPLKFVALVIAVLATVVVGIRLNGETTNSSDSKNAKPDAQDSRIKVDGKEISLVGELHRVAKEYEKWGRFDDEAHWAPWLCRMPAPGMARFSKSDDSDNHGQKLYSLFAKNRFAYQFSTSDKPEVNRARKSVSAKKLADSAPIRQVLVKESWSAKLADDVKRDKKAHFPYPIETKPNDNRDTIVGSHHFSPYAERDGKVYKANEKMGLYVMLQFDPKTPNTDDGWVYGTVSADGKTVTSAGLVKSCMECHQQAPHGRLFGIPYKGL